jgi:DNA-binding transcriptional MerR regulator
MKANVFQETAAAVARRFGVSVKALRVYERAGLLKPARTVAGWRIYRQLELERLSAILALKQLGLPLKRIGELLKGEGDLAAALALQEAALEAAKADAEDALRLVRAARAKLAAQRSLSPDELSHLVRSTAMSEFKWNDKRKRWRRSTTRPSNWRPCAPVRLRPKTRRGSAPHGRRCSPISTHWATMPIPHRIGRLTSAGAPRRSWTNSRKATPRSCRRLRA